MRSCDRLAICLKRVVDDGDEVLMQNDDGNEVFMQGKHVEEVWWTTMLNDAG